MSRYKEICGCIHIHYPIKKLEKTFISLAQDGQAAGIDFLIINSHTPNKKIATYVKLFDKEGYYGRTLVINGEEAEDRLQQNHLLIIGGKKWYGNRDNISQVFSEIKNSGCLSFIAHPEGFHKFFIYRKDYRWDNRTLNDFNGIEIWSLLFDWAKFTRIYNLPIRYFCLPRNLKGPSSSLLSLWDSLAQKKTTVGIAGLDIHLLPFVLRCLDINNKFKYSNIFKVLRNHILLEEELVFKPEEDKQKIFNALRKGHLFFSNDYLSDSSGFYFGSEDGYIIMGDTINIGRPLVVKNPVSALTRLVFNGRILWENQIKTTVFVPGHPGVYRIEVFYQGLPWIFSNHISIR